MKKYPFVRFVLGFLILQAAVLRASSLDDKIAALKTAMKAEQTAKASSGTAMNSYSERTLNMALSNATDSMTDQVLRSAIDQISTSYTSDAVQKAGQDVLDEMTKERKDASDAAVADLTGFLNSITDTVRKAKTPADLDALLVQLQKRQPRNNTGNELPEISRLNQQIYAANQFVTLWQDYLSALQAGQTMQAQNALRSLAQGQSMITILPRSELLQRANDLSNPSGGGDTDSNKAVAAGILKGLKSLDDIKPALDRLDSLHLSANGIPDDVTSEYNRLKGFARAYDEVTAGLPLDVQVIHAGMSSDRQLIPAEITSKILILILARGFDTYKGPAATENEMPDAFINQVIADASSRQDWALLWKALSVQADLNRNSGLAMGDSVAGMDFLIDADNQEKAGQYALAVESYLRALGSPDAHIPAKIIGDRLTAIKKDHSEEYELGLKNFHTVPAPMNQPYGSYFNPYGPNTNPLQVRQAMQGRTPMNQILQDSGATAPSTIHLPATNSTSAPVAPAPSNPSTNAVPVTTPAVH